MRFNIGNVIIEGTDIYTIAIIRNIIDETYIVQALEIFADTSRKHRINLVEFEMDENGASGFKLLIKNDDTQSIIKLLFQREIVGRWR